jgi:two-component system response regulator YesN
MKLLIADDEQYIRTTLTQEIDWAKHGISLQGAATDGKESIELCRRYQPDVLLMDIRMPYFSGIEVMKQLKTELPKMRTILLSGWSDFEYAREAIKFGASNYLVKPCPDEEILDAVLVLFEELGFTRTGHKQASPSTVYDKSIPKQSIRHAIKLACEMIHRNLSIAVTLTEIAGEINMNPSAFSRLFRQEMNCSFSEYVTSARMNLAKKLLIESNIKIQDIAQKVGYVSVSHFVQVFGDYTGMTPGTFREING